MNKDKIIDLALYVYGDKQQLNQTNEELAELIVEVAKNIRGFNNRRNIIEEMADVLHCFEYLKKILNIHDEEIQDMLNYKLNRTYERIKEGYDVSKIKFRSDLEHDRL